MTITQLLSICEQFQSLDRDAQLALRMASWGTRLDTTPETRERLDTFLRFARSMAQRDDRLREDLEEVRDLIDYNEDRDGLPLEAETA